MQSEFDRVLIVDDHNIVRAALAAEVQTVCGAHSVIDQAGTIKEAIDLVKTHRPKMLVLDHQLGDATGFDLIEGLKNTPFQCDLIVITQSNDPHIIKNYWGMGVRGLVSKSSTLSEIRRAFQCIQNKDAFLSAEFRDIIFSSKMDFLTKRELDIVRHIAQGKTNKEIAAELNCSDETIKSHKANIMAKLNINTSVEIATWAVKNGLA